MGVDTARWFAEHGSLIASREGAPMSRIFEIADKYVDELAALDPSTATALGIPGHEREMPDYSPEGAARIAALNQRTLQELQGETAADDRERVAQEFMAERMGV